jgi:membrane protein DedA with SNARE-associated domain
LTPSRCSVKFFQSSQLCLAQSCNAAAPAPLSSQKIAGGRLAILDRAVAWLAAIITAIISALGYPGIVLMMALESSLIPIPSEVVMPFGGFLAATGRFNLLAVAVAGAVGCNIGSTAIYYLGAERGRHIVEKYGRYIALDKKKLAQMEHYFHRWGGITLLLTRMLPLFPVVISLPAGVARMPMWKFQLYTFVGCFIWCLGLAALGYEFGLAWKSQPCVKLAIHYADIALVVAIVLAIAWFAWRHFFVRKR